VTKRSNVKGFLILIWTWFALIVLSVLFTYQHHIVDILTGTLLAYWIYQFHYRPKFLDLKPGPG